MTTELSTTGGTSDGRFIAKICPQVIGFGPATPPSTGECEHIEIASLDPLKNIYRRTLENLPVRPDSYPAPRGTTPEGPPGRTGAASRIEYT